MNNRTIVTSHKQVLDYLLDNYAVGRQTASAAVYDDYALEFIGYAIESEWTLSSTAAKVAKTNKMRKK